ncbi:NfeD family protein [Aestuariimicrobium sp. Y1814]|uniref:NfeD family protein n=1 Tax=Aestuariimicrobium sp. Y1814 TaxID=3418742 RepID=UPI003DA74B60
MDFGEWIRENLWAGWFGLGLVLGTAEMLTLDMTLLMLAGGAVAGGLTALVLPGFIVVQVLVALVVSVLLLLLARPTLLERVRKAPGYRNSLNQLVGAQATATAEITDDGGEVKVEGQVWNAKLVVPGRVAFGQKVEVQEVNGTTLMVYPLEAPPPDLDHGGSDPMLGH